MCWQKIKNYFKKKPEVKPKIDLAQLRWKSEKLFKRIFRMISTKKPGPNMPKHQPCPDCYARSKRGRKFIEGAKYHCHSHGEFYVRSK